MNEVITRIEAWVRANWADWVTVDQLVSGLTAAAMLVVGFVVARLAAGGVARLVGTHGSVQAAMVARMVVYYAILLVTLATALGQLGIDLSVLLGAAGILTVALGFAAQTSASNLISGVFLLGERSFQVGDFIQIGATEGEVVSIDPLSVKLRTFANLLVRVPNESLLKTEIINLTHFPIRRYDLQIRVEHSADVARVREVLRGVADEHHLCLDEPRAEVWFKEFEPDGIRLQFSVWSATQHFFELRNTIPDRVKLAFDEAGIKLARPVRHVMVAGSTGNDTRVFVQE